MTALLPLLVFVLMAVGGVILLIDLSEKLIRKIRRHLRPGGDP